MIFTSLARANECVHIHKRTFPQAKKTLPQAKRNFPQAKLNSEINAGFLLNRHGDLYFLLYKIV